MKPYGFSVMICICILISGCSSKESHLFFVMFNEKPEITNSGVFSGTAEIGRIVSVKSGFDNICEVSIAIDSAYVEKIKNNVVFCVTDGRLEYHTLTGAGDPLATESPVRGFGSNLALSWFKVKNTLNNLSMEAAKSARELHQKIRWAELIETS